MNIIYSYHVYCSHNDKKLVEFLDVLNLLVLSKDVMHCNCRNKNEYMSGRSYKHTSVYVTHKVNFVMTPHTSLSNIILPYQIYGR